MLIKKIKGLLVVLLITTSAFAQPGDSELKVKVNEYYGNTPVVDIKFDAAKVEKRWVKDAYKYYWSKKYNVKTKTEYPGVFHLAYGGVQYNKDGSTYTFDRILGGAPYRIRRYP